VVSKSLDVNLLPTVARAAISVLSQPGALHSAKNEKKY